jgi:uncharacterized membrane protein YgcG
MRKRSAFRCPASTLTLTRWPLLVLSEQMPKKGVAGLTDFVCLGSWPCMTLSVVNALVPQCAVIECCADADEPSMVVERSRVCLLCAYSPVALILSASLLLFSRVSGCLIPLCHCSVNRRCAVCCGRPHRLHGLVRRAHKLLAHTARAEAEYDSKQRKWVSSAEGEAVYRSVLAKHEKLSAAVHSGGPNSPRSEGSRGGSKGSSGGSGGRSGGGGGGATSKSRESASLPSGEKPHTQRMDRASVSDITLHAMQMGHNQQSSAAASAALAAAEEERAREKNEKPKRGATMESASAGPRLSVSLPAVEIERSAMSASGL